jgi:glycerophosphoryl diester phosphodiesterase
VRRWNIGWGYRDAAGERPFAHSGLVMPTLDELLGAFTVRLNVDIKQRTPSMIDPLLEVVRRHDAEHRVTMASFHGDVIRAVRRRGYAGETVLARDEVLALMLAPQGLRRWLGHGGDAVQVPVAAGPIDCGARRFIERCHAEGLRVDYWTVNDPVVAEVLLERGADGIISDDPRALAPVFARHR